MIFFIERICKKVRDSYHFVKRLYRWAPLIWKDCDCDHSALIKVMLFKVSEMRKACPIEPYDKQLKVAEILLERLDKDVFYDNNKQREAIRQKGWQACKCWHQVIPQRGLRLGWCKIKKQQCLECRRLPSRLEEEKEAKERADREFVFNYIGKKINRWWW